MDEKPVLVSAHGVSHAGNDIENIAYISLSYQNSFIAHFHVNWLSPVKVRKTMIAGSEKMLVGKNCKISSHTFICEGVTIRDNVFIGHNVTFINDKYPKAANPDGNLQTEADWSVTPTLVEEGASIGSSVTILCGITIGMGATVGAGSVVTKDIPPREVWTGNPARFMQNAER